MRTRAVPLIALLIVAAHVANCSSPKEPAQAPSQPAPYPYGAPQAPPPYQTQYPAAQYPAPYPNAQYPAAQYPAAPGTYPATPPPSQPPAYWPPAQPQPQPQAPSSSPVPAGAAAQLANDPVNRADLAFLRARAASIMAELARALSPDYQRRVQGIPLVVDDTVGEVNAFAACSKGRALMAISDGMLQIEAYLAQAAAYDELFGSRKLDEYIALVARSQRPQQPVVAPPTGFFEASRHTDGRKIARQHQILEEQVAFVLGHELGHHYLGHLPCTGQDVPLADLGQALAGLAPAFNQPNEYAADGAGTQNVLTAGARRRATAYGWTENGGLLTMRFFSGLRGGGATDLIFSFERSHPPPEWRTGWIQAAASAWRYTGSSGLTLPF